ncbi:MAG: hypothetical protein ACT4QD_20695 [Acidobacteriota bacterium]
MDVFLIPTAKAGRYELYFEPPGKAIDSGPESPGLFRRMTRKFDAMLHEAEEWRHRRQEQRSEPPGLVGRLRRRIMGFVVERIAEQRLLWHLRKATEVRARMPADLMPADADRIVRQQLKADADHHLKWMFIDLALLAPATLLTIVPGPNVIGLYFTFQVVGHLLSMRGAKKGLSGVTWHYDASADLAELRAAMMLEPAARKERVRELARRLQLEHLATFCETVRATST